MHITPEQVAILLQKVLQGTATDAEKKQAALYLQQKDAQIDLDQLLPYSEWSDMEEGNLPHGLRERVIANVLESPAGKEIRMETTQKKGVWLRWIAGAAALFIMAVAGLTVYRTADKQPDTIVWVAFVADKGQVKQLWLPDSTRVYLNAGSRIEYAKAFAGNQRLVRLTGEAFFEVAQQAAKPFVVASDAIRTTVLGTSFNIKAYPKEELSVTVTSGKVKVETADAPHAAMHTALLDRGQYAAYSRRNGTLGAGTIDLTTLSDWKNNRLVFDDASLEDIIHTLERRYNVTFDVHSKALLESKYSVTFNQLTLQESLDKLKLLGDIRWKQQGSVVSLMEKQQ